MPDITPSVAPGAYPGAQSINWTFDPSVSQVAYTVNGLPPALSEYIAYDTLTPANPFIAVTQDGAGNVVYDGGFPKLYNQYAVLPQPSGYSIRLHATNTASGGNDYYYDCFSELDVLIESGDKLVYDIFCTGITCQSGVDAVLTNGAFTALRHYNDIVDQNGIRLHPVSDISARARRTWYHREIDLTPAAGATATRWMIGLEADGTGLYQANVKEVYVKRADGTTKATLFNESTGLTVPALTAVTSTPSYTGMSKAVGTPYTLLSPAFKYMYNVLNFIANPDKVAAGNRKFLVLGDRTAAPYIVKGTGINDFFTSLEYIAASGQWFTTYKDPSDYGGVLNPSLAELEEYVGVILLSTNVATTSLLTDNAEIDLRTFRSNGNGIVIITDHGPNIANIGSAYPIPGSPSGFFATANKLARNFGAYFTGDYNRVPVNVGYIRTNFGDHPLYAGLTNDEDIYASASESKVVVTEYPMIAPGAMPTTNVNSGTNTVRFLVKKADGSIATYSFVYMIASGDVIEFRDGSNNIITGMDVGWNYKATIKADVLGTGLGSLSGFLYQNNNKVGELLFTEAGGSKEIWFRGEPIVVNNGDIIKATIESPFTYQRSISVTRKQADINDVNGLAKICQMLEPLPAAGLRERVIQRVTDAVTPYYPFTYNNAGGKNVLQLRNYMKNTLPIPDLNVYAYDIPAALTDALGRLVPPTMQQIFNAWSRYDVDLWYPSGTTPTGDAAAWYWDNALGSAVQPNNTVGQCGFVSNYDVLDYDLEVTLTSTNADDDYIGVVLAFVRDTVNNQNHTLDLVLSRGAKAFNDRAIWPDRILCIDFTDSPTWATQTNRYKELAIGAAPDTNGWNNNYRRVKVMRRGDQFSVQMSDWNSATYNAAYNMSVNLNDRPELAQFKGAKPFGFSTKSQPGTSFKDLVFSDGYRRDVILDMLNNRVYRYFNGAWQLVAGVTVHSIFGAPRVINAIEGGKRYQLNANGTITVL